MNKLAQQFQTMEHLHDILNVVSFLNDSPSFDKEKKIRRELLDLFDKVQCQNNEAIPEAGIVMTVPERMIEAEGTRGWIMRFSDEAVSIMDHPELDRAWVSAQVLRREDESGEGRWRIWIGRNSYFLMFQEGSQKCIKVPGRVFANILIRSGSRIKEKPHRPRSAAGKLRLLLF